MKNAKFIWTDNKKYISCRKTVFDKSETANFRVCAFKKTFTFEEEIQTAVIKIFADTKYFLYINGSFIGTGPVCAGGDYEMTEPMPVQYYSIYDLKPESSELEVFVLVQLDPYSQTDTSLGRGGLVFLGELSFENSENVSVISDKSWLASPAYNFPEANLYDYTKDAYSWKAATEIENPGWNLKTSQIPSLSYVGKEAVNKAFPVYVESGETKEVILEFDKIYSAYLYLNIGATGKFEITASMGEVLNRVLQTEIIKGDESIVHQGILMASVGVLRLKIKNMAETTMVLRDASVLFFCYPTSGENGSFTSSDPDLNNIYELGRHTLTICRQTIHLNSPAHQENLGCVGDYYIESLIGYYTFSDTRLTRFDIIRIADYLNLSGGYMFHTTYSLIWVQMLYDYYMYTGDVWAVEYCAPALKTLMDKMESYEDESFIIQNPPSWMFVDRVWRDEKHNMHHPPKVMGQAVMNAFYFSSLKICSKLFAFLGKSETSARYRVKSLSLKTMFNKTFFDNNCGLYFDGLSDAQEENGEFRPRNIGGKYFSKYTNVLAVLFGICDDCYAGELLERVLYYEDLGGVQPYFMHYVLEAIYKVGLFEKYGLKEIRRWKSLYDECSKGMKETWIYFEGYKTDYSHAWGATPTYQLPSKISGLEILEPGMKKVKFNPNLFGLESARIKIPTPYGTIEMNLSDSADITTPKEIEVVI